jgi:PAS domain S-box-containing protein
MTQSKVRYLKDFFLLKKAESTINADDIVSKQRLNLFKTYSLTAFIIALIITYQVISTFNWFDFIGIILTGLTGIIVVNYFLLNKHLNLRLAYMIAIASSMLTLHVVTYYSGGIRNSGMMYLGGLILVTFMLLGNREGKIISVLSVITLFFFYYISTFSGLDVRNIIDSDSSGHMLNLDYLITYCTATLLIYSLSNNLENSKNNVIAKVTEAKESLELKNEELKKLSLVASNTDNSVIITNKDGFIEWVNLGFERIKGYSLPEVLGKTTQELFYGPLTNEETINSIKHNIAHKKSFSGEVLKYRKDGTSIWLQVTITPILDGQGEVTRFIHVESDISERKKSEERLAEYYMYLEKANKELDKFAYVVSHDLKAPLRAISNLSSWIEEDIGDRFTEDSAQHFTMLKGRIVRMESLINGILEYSRADRVKSPNVMVDVKALINEIFELIVQNSNVTIELPENLPVINTERMKLQQVFLNLISNSIKYNDKENAIIKIACVEEEEAYTFSVEDNGPGIEERYHEKVFIIFQTLQARDTFESTGVGLAIVKKIIDETGGEIWIESELEIYTRFLFKWPKKSSSSFKSVQQAAEKTIQINSSSLTLNTAN